MDTQDITKEQFETLVLVRSLEEFITEEHENLSSLSEVIWTLEESLSDGEHKQLVSDICKLTETGYLLSDGTEEHIEIDRIPEVEGITPRGEAVLDEFEHEIQKKVSSGEKVILFKDCSLFNFSLLSELDVSGGVFDTVGSLFKFIGKVIKK